MQYQPDRGAIGAVATSTTTIEVNVQVIGVPLAPACPWSTAQQQFASISQGCCNVLPAVCFPFTLP